MGWDGMGGWDGEGGALLIIIAAYVPPGGLERAGGCGLGHLCVCLRAGGGELTFF